MKPHQTQTLFVYLNNHKVGQIDLLDKQFIFQYANEWLIQPNAIPLSLTLPLQSEPFDPKKSRAFFRNLLPEGNVRQAVARSLKISEQNDFALLEALGGECAGAIFVLPQDVPPIEKQSYSHVGWAKSFSCPPSSLKKWWATKRRCPPYMALSGGQQKDVAHPTWL
jgi:serine/threonine-protein kinase HipA